MYNPRSHRGRLIGCVVAAVMLVGILGVVDLALPRGDEIEPRGGTVWDARHQVAVRVSQGGVRVGTTVKFGLAGSVHESPLSDLLDVLHAPVDIEVDHPVNDAEVMFEMDPRIVPLHPRDTKGRVQRSILNAGIQVYDPALEIWISLPTSIEGESRLVARAPHFSIFRAVLAKVGETQMSLDKSYCSADSIYAPLLNLNCHINQVLSYGTKPADLLVDTARNLGQTFIQSLLGKFDNSKFICIPAARGLAVQITRTRLEEKIAGCAIQGRNGNQILVKNGLAAPYAYFVDIPGVHSDFLASVVADIVSYTTGLLGLLIGGVNVGPLDVAKLSVSRAAPDNFDLLGDVNWSAAIADIAINIAGIILPEGEAAKETATTLQIVLERLEVQVEETVAHIAYDKIEAEVLLVTRERATPAYITRQVLDFIDLINCAGIVQGQLKGSIRNLPQAIGNLVRTCLADAFLNQLSIEQQSGIQILVDTLKSIQFAPEIGDLAAIGTGDFVTLQNVSATTLSVGHGWSPNTSAGLDWSTVVQPIMGCPIPDLWHNANYSRFKPSLQYGDLTNDGLPEAIVTASCPSPVSTWPTHVMIFDGRSLRRPFLLLDINAIPGLAVGSIADARSTVTGSILQVSGDGWSDSAPNCCPDTQFRTAYAWSGNGFKQFKRDVSVAGKGD